jgi:nucleoside 2-deoxyribosyltransferase
VESLRNGDYMRIYLAGAWARKQEIKAVADDLNSLGYGIYVDSRWLDEKQIEYGGEEGTPDEIRRERAEIDISDVEDADMVVRFTDDLSAPTVPSSLATGARMVEMGVAIALGIPVVVVGGHQPIFDYLPEVTHVKDVDELKQYLLEEARG